MRVALFVFLVIVATGCTRVTSAIPPDASTDATARLASNSSYHIFHDFSGADDGIAPTTRLVEVDGTFYGTTLSGGKPAAGSCRDCGTVYSITPSGAEKVIYSFSGPPDGQAPKGNLIVGVGGLYGTAVNGGKINTPRCPKDGKGCGVVFRVAADGTATTLYGFGLPGDGAHPEGGLVPGNGLLYGTTTGVNGRMGTVFSYSTSFNELKTVYRFGAPPNDGDFPVGSLTEINRTLYGVTAKGGADNLGTIFELVPRTGAEKILHSFTGADGATPAGGLTPANGLLYGVASSEGPNGHGVIFAISASGTYHVVHAFRGSDDGDGARPLSPPIFVYGTNLYGTTLEGGADGHGTVYRIDVHGKESILHSFGALPDGAYPEAALVWRAGMLYGTTVKGGSANHGTVFTLPAN